MQEWTSRWKRYAQDACLRGAVPANALAHRPSSSARAGTTICRTACRAAPKTPRNTISRRRGAAASAFGRANASASIATAGLSAGTSAFYFCGGQRRVPAATRGESSVLVSSAIVSLRPPDPTAPLAAKGPRFHVSRGVREDEVGEQDGGRLRSKARQLSLVQSLDIAA